MVSVLAHLQQVPLFEGMTANAQEAVAALAEEEVIPDGMALTREGEVGEAFYLVVDGQVRVSRNGHIVRELGPGDFLGEISLVDGRPRTATSVAVGDVKVLVIRRPAFLELIDRFGAVRLGILMALSDRVRNDRRDGVD